VVAKIGPDGLVIHCSKNQIMSLFGGKSYFDEFFACNGGKFFSASDEVSNLLPPRGISQQQVIQRE
jgi:hypothetical protein